MLQKGFYKIHAGYIEATGGESIIVRYKGPGIEKALIPDSILFYEIPENYEIPPVTIISPNDSTSYFTANSASITADARGQFPGSIYKITFLINGVVKTTCYGDSCEAKPVLSSGTNTLQAMGYDIYGNDVESKNYTFFLKPNSINSMSSESIIIFPNPIKNSSVTISNLNEGIKQISITSISGSKILQVQTSDNSYIFNNLNLNTGVYFINIKNSNSLSVLKLIVN